MDTPNLAFRLKSIYDNCLDLASINSAMTIFLFDLYSKFKTEADEYVEQRDKYNRDLNLSLATEAEISLIRQLLKENDIVGELIDTSSVRAQTSISGSSDIDISLLVDDVDVDETVQILTTRLQENGYNYQKLVNKQQPLNCYHSFEAIRNIGDTKIEFELKLRSKTKSRAIMSLHQYINDNISITEKKTITYGKFIFKLLSVSGTNENEKLSYILFKKLVYEMYFYHIDGGFLLELHC